jgi:carbonic anhydrase
MVTAALLRPADIARHVLMWSLLAAAFCIAPRAEASAPQETARDKPAGARTGTDKSTADRPLTDKTAAKAEPAEAAPAPRRAGPRPGPMDPMDIIRERLAARLGSAKVPSKPTPDGAVKVLSKNPTPEKPAPVRMASLSPSLAGAGSSGPRGATGGARPVALPAGSAHWSYDGEHGPAAWAQLSPEFAACGSGQRQSPIDLRDGIKVDLDPIQFDYRPSNFRVIDNGHTVQVSVAEGSTIEVAGKRFELVNFHFHRPSEERIDGKPFDMVVHLVHRGAEGRQAVVAVLLDKGSAQPVVQAVWNNLPLEKGDEVRARLPIDLNALLPVDRRYYTYMGSLTEPPCSEGVLWMVMKTPVEVSPEQIAIFSRLYPMNARPIQSVSGRIIKESN